MPTDSRYAILFEPVKIGPKTAKNRFYQVPHCNGGGYRDPSAVAEMRRTKAEGGWGVIFTEQTEIHPTSEITPFIEQHLWEDKDIPALAAMAEAMKSGGALAGIQLAYSGINGPNLYSREVPLAVTGGPILTFTSDPVQARTMDREDIRDLRRWFRNAFRRSQTAGFDLICLYGAHGFGILQHFLSRATNHRTDEYGGSLENRARFLREIVEEAREETRGELAISLRLSLHEGGAFGFSNAELRDFIEMHGELPDIWDLAHGTWEACSGTSRFKPEGAQEDLVAGIKALTPKPVVGVGRFTSADAMVRQIRAGVLDFIGAARPSIADPFLPKKIEEGRFEDIRECIGCNICVSGDMTGGISRCTQNTAFMEEWRKGWHPERARPKGPSGSVLVVGAGPAGLEAALQAGRRGYAVTLAEATTVLGGRVAKERTLPGLAAWGRVADYRTGQMAPMTNVEIYRDSSLSADDVLAMGAEHVAIATGASWRRDAVARLHLHPIPTDAAMPVYSPDDLMAGIGPTGGRVMLYDDDHFYMGSVMAEVLAARGCQVDFVTPAAKVAEWAENTLEQAIIMRRLLEIGVRVHLSKAPEAIGPKEVTLGCTWTGAASALAADAVVMVTSRLPHDALYHDLRARQAEWADAGVKSVQLIGDAAAPGPIAWATYAGRRFAEELDTTDDRGDTPRFRREVAGLEPGPSRLP
ncbi:NADH:flavin oxidoreductase [Gemmobacter aquaticus]|uniref:NADH:flavin oxidoreductase n=1 Tax=Gemmobacter aquaticus TaxID=490185 RepID=A0A917YJC5_9RHOB|nr:FAD-dependent oxidoreductase [Gemmobacter aquaticus]GGO30172.1 NADH:flavin oxidoreductase [Gemmobacter aquaticus]